MSILPILTYPDPLLREESKAIEIFDENIKQLANDMIETVVAAPGAGLAAPQVGRLCRLIVVDMAENEDDYGKEFLVLANPVIVHSEGEQLFTEGCLSVVDLRAQVTRFDKVEVEAQDLEGRPFKVTAEGRLAVILQHETDHLDGLLFLDRLHPVKRNMYKRKIKKSLRKDD